MDNNQLTSSLHYNQGNAYFRQSLFADAINSYNKAIQADPYCKEAYLNLGAAYSRVGRNLDAIRVYEEALLIVKPQGIEDAQL